MQSGSQQRLSLRSDGWMLTGSERIRTCNQVEWNDVKAREVSQTSSYSVCPPPSCRRTLVFHPGVPCCYAFVCIIGFFLLMNHTLLRAQLVFICSLSLVKLSSPVRTTITGSEGLLCAHTAGGWPSPRKAAWALTVGKVPTLHTKECPFNIYFIGV